MAKDYVDIHDFDTKLATIKAKITNDTKILPVNKNYILQLATFMEAKALKLSTIHKDLYSLRFIGQHLTKDFKTCDRNDMMRVCGEIHKQLWTEKTKRNHLVAVKKMWRWLDGIEEKGVYPKAVSWINTASKKRSSKLPEDILREDEVNRLLSVCENPRDKALINLLYESGARIGELLNLRIKHIVFADWGGAYVMLNGKTGMRRVTVVASVPVLATYLDLHPFKDDPENFLFVVKRSGGGKAGYRQMTYASVRKVLKIIVKKAGIKKRIHPHLFRHSSATRAARFLTESQMKEYFGWTGGSEMPATYVHLSGRDMEDAIKKMHGIKTETQEKVKATITTCFRCKQKNSPGSKFCNTCGLVLDLQTAMKLDRKQKGANNLLHRAMQEDPVLLQNPKFLAEFIQKEIDKRLSQSAK